MDPRIGVGAGILSGLLSCFAFLLVSTGAMLRSWPDARDLTTSVDPPDAAFEYPERFRLVAYESQFTIRVGNPVQIDFSLCNLSNDTIYIPQEEFFPQKVRSRRGDLPSCVVEILDANGTPQAFVGPDASSGAAAPLKADGFRAVKPGGFVAFRHPLQNWKPTSPGTYTFRMALDTRGEIPEAWDRRGPPVDPTALPKLRRMPQGLFVSNPVTIVVEPP